MSYGNPPAWWSNVESCPQCGERHVRGSNDAKTCAGHRTGGKPCRMWPIPGGWVCAQRHGGKSEQVKRGASWRLAVAELEREAMSIIESGAFFGGELDIEPAEVMLLSVRKSAWLVAKYELLIQGLNEWVDDFSEAPVLIDSEGNATVHPSWVGAGIAGRVDPANWKAEPHVLVRMYNEERDRLMRYAKMCRDANIDERLVQIAEAQGEWVIAMVTRILDALGLTPAQEAKLPQLIEGVIVELENGPER